MIGVLIIGLVGLVFYFSTRETEAERQANEQKLSDLLDKIIREGAEQEYQTFKESMDRYKKESEEE